MGHPIFLRANYKFYPNEETLGRVIAMIAVNPFIANSMGDLLGQPKVVMALKSDRPLLMGKFMSKTAIALVLVLQIVLQITED